MKYLLLFIISIGTFTGRSYSQHRITAFSELTHVNVYRKGAELHHKANIQLQAGMHEIRIYQISKNIAENSILFSPNKQFDILNVFMDNDEVNKKEVDSNYRFYLKNFNELQHVKHQIQSLTGAQSILDANKKVNGKGTQLSVTELSKVITFYENKTMEIQTKLNELSQRKDQLMAELSEMQEDYKEVSCLVVQLKCSKPIQTSLEFSYFTESASWQPHYDIKSEGSGSSLTLALKAEVTQFSGLDWKNITMALNTSNPSVSGLMPTLSPWFIKHQSTPQGKEQMNNGLVDNYKFSSGDFAAFQNSVYQRKTPSFEENNSSANKKPQIKLISGGSESESDFHTQYEVNIPYTILSNASGYSSIPIKEYELSTNYKYYAIPKKDPDAFFLAEITDWASLNLISGPANIFFNGSFTGKSAIDASSTRDTLNVSLGRDKHIIVKREKMKDFSTHKVVGNKKAQTITYEIRIRNTRKEKVQLIVEDQIPLSTDKDIEIEVEDISGANRDEQSGILTWKLEIPPNETKKLKISYTVKYPKDQNISPLF